jgi:hypothetical protein
MLGGVMALRIIAGANAANEGMNGEDAPSSLDASEGLL